LDRDVRRSISVEGRRSDQSTRGGPAGIKGLALGEHVPDGGGELAGDLDPGNLAAPLAAEASLGVLVPLAVDGVTGGVGGRLDERPAQVLGTVARQRSPVVPAARLADEGAQAGLPGELLGGREP
jgi:hypothetical protein